MRSKSHLTFALFSLSALMAVGCATTNLPSISSTGPAFEPTSDEIRLWNASRLEERTLLEHVTLYEDEDFVARTEELIDRLAPDHHSSRKGPNYQVFLIESEELNAFSYPHGSIYLHTGLLSTLEGEDQLAAILAHEIQHIEGRHSLRKQRQERNSRRRWTAVSVGSIAALIALDIDAIDDGNWARHDFLTFFADDLLAIGLYGLSIAAEASIRGYGEEMEFEADDGAFRRLASAGYDVEEGARVFDQLIDEANNGQGSRSFFYSNPDELEARRERALERWVGDGELRVASSE